MKKYSLVCDFLPRIISSRRLILQARVSFLCYYNENCKSSIKLSTAYLRLFLGISILLTFISTAVFMQIAEYYFDGNITFLLSLELFIVLILNVFLPTTMIKICNMMLNKEKNIQMNHEILK